MKEVLSVFMFGIWALFFVVFFIAIKPDTVAAVAGSIRPEYCNTEGSPMCQCPPHVFAAMSGAVVPTWKRSKC
jgi:hypothetical protein